MDDRELEHRMDHYLDEMRAKIEEYGWGLQGVFSSADDLHPSPGFVYTIGLTHMGHPELIAFGMGHDTASTIMNDLGERIQGGEVLVPRQRYDNVVKLADGGDLAVEFLPVPASAHHEYFGVAIRILGRGKFTALQMVWPDPGGKMPWEPEFDQRFKPMQPVLDHDWTRRN